MIKQIRKAVTARAIDEMTAGKATAARMKLKLDHMHNALHQLMLKTHKRNRRAKITS